MRNEEATAFSCLNVATGLEHYIHYLLDTKFFQVFPSHKGNIPLKIPGSGL